MELKEFYIILTLVDITHTNEYRENNKQRNQQRNYDTLMQTIGLFTQATPVTDVDNTKPQTLYDQNMIVKITDHIKLKTTKICRRTFLRFSGENFK